MNRYKAWFIMSYGVLLGLLLLVSALCSGCATAQHDFKPFTYTPKAPQGLVSIDAAEKELALLLGNTSVPIVYRATEKFPNWQALKAFVEHSKPDLSRAGKQLSYFDGERMMMTITPGVTVSNGRLEIPVFPLTFDQLPGFPITVTEYERDNEVNLPNGVILSTYNPEKTRRVADVLVFIQQNIGSYMKEQLARFEKKATEYRSLQTKPKLGEDQRRFIVQAEAYREQRNYEMAIRKYLEAVEIDPVSYPAAYSNLALLYERQNNPRRAIFYMKHYLLLEPEGKEARGAQDKIYQWETLLPPILEITTLLTTSPPDAMIEVNVTDSGKDWIYAGRAPQNLRFWRVNATQRAMLKVSKPGYLPQEKIFSFDTCPDEIHLDLAKAATGDDNQAQLGISRTPLTEEAAKPLGLQAGQGDIVEYVAKDSIAERAGLKKGDVILAIDGKKLVHGIDLPMAVASAPIGSTLHFTVYRDNSQHTISVKIERASNGTAK